MTSNRMLRVIILAASLSAPAIAGAQPQAVPPPKPPTPPAAPQPAPRPDPWVIRTPDLEPLMVLQNPDVWRPLQELRVPDFEWSVFTANDAMDKARWMLDDMQFDYQNNVPYRLGAAGRSQGEYSTGKDLLNQRKYAEAIGHFDRVIAQKTTNADGALYWKAYAQFKLGKSDESLATIAILRKDYGQTRYLPDAKALEADAKRMAGQPINPAAMDDDDLKMLAINGIKNTDPERAIPLLENVLSSTNSLRVKKQALYVLASMSKQPRAHQILLTYAKGGGNPELQLEAIRDLAANTDKQATTAELMQIYQSTQDTDVKLAVIGGLRIAGGNDFLYRIAGSGDSPMVLRSSALNGAASAFSAQDLMTLFEKESNKELRVQIVSVLASMQATEQISRIIRTEKDPDVLRAAIRSLGRQPAAKTGSLLVDLYTSSSDLQTRKTVISALAGQDNAEALVAIARKETTRELKVEIVSQLSGMASKSKVAADYLMEIIK